MTSRSINRVFLLLVIALTLLPVLGYAQPAPAASAPAALTAADITFDSPCGAPGVGRVWAGERREQIEPRDGQPSHRVNAAGYWEVGCKPPAPPSPPAACPGSEAAATWTVDGATCTATGRRGSGPFDTGSIPGVAHGGTAKRLQWAGAMRGSITYGCTDGVRSVVAASCAAATQCDTAIRLNRDGIEFAYNGATQPAQLGAFVFAKPSKSAFGSPSLRLQCVAGEWVEAPACTARQELPQTVYLWDGPALQPGQVGTARLMRGTVTRSDSLPVVCRADGTVAPR